MLGYDIINSYTLKAAYIKIFKTSRFQPFLMTATTSIKLYKERVFNITHEPKSLQLYIILQQQLL